MLLNYIFLAISSSIDSLGIGITYGIKNTKITTFAKCVLFLVAFTISTVSIYFGNLLKYLFPDNLIDYLGCVILICMGIFMCFHALKNNKKDTKIAINTNLNHTEKIYSFFINCLGITIKIIKNPISSDFDKSNTIDSKEALFLGLALSLDSFGIGFSYSLMNVNCFLFPIFISFFQILFLSLGSLWGKKLKSISKFPDYIYSFLSGILLILIGVFKL